MSQSNVNVIIKPTVNRQVILNNVNGLSILTQAHKLVTSLAVAESVGQYVVVTSDGFVANSNNMAHRTRVLGITLAAINFGFAGLVITQGEVANPLWSFSQGGDIYLNGSTLSHIPPTTGFQLYIGSAVSSTTIDVNRSTFSVIL